MKEGQCVDVTARFRTHSLFDSFRVVTYFVAVGNEILHT